MLDKISGTGGVSVTWNNRRHRKQSGLLVQPGSEVTPSLLSSSWAPVRDTRVNEAGGPIMVGSGFSQWRGEGTPDTGIGNLIAELGEACHILGLRGVRQSAARKEEKIRLDRQDMVRSPS